MLTYYSVNLRNGLEMSSTWNKQLCLRKRDFTHFCRLQCTRTQGPKYKLCNHTYMIIAELNLRKRAYTQKRLKFKNSNSTGYMYIHVSIRCLCICDTFRPPYIRVCFQKYVLISQPNLMLLVLKRTVSMRRFF